MRNLSCLMYISYQKAYHIIQLCFWMIRGWRWIWEMTPFYVLLSVHSLCTIVFLNSKCHFYVTTSTTIVAWHNNIRNLQNSHLHLKLKICSSCLLPVNPNIIFPISAYCGSIKEISQLFSFISNSYPFHSRQSNSMRFYYSLKHHQYRIWIYICP